MRACAHLEFLLDMVDEIFIIFGYHDISPASTDII